MKKGIISLTLDFSDTKFVESNPARASIVS
jgi:hypothetical protein